MRTRYTLNKRNIIVALGHVKSKKKKHYRDNKVVAKTILG